MRVEITITDDRPASDDTEEWGNTIRLFGEVEIDPADLLGGSPEMLFRRLVDVAKGWSPE